MECLRVYNELTIDQLPVGLIAQLLKLSIYCDDLHLLKMFTVKTSSTCERCSTSSITKKALTACEGTKMFR